MNALWVRLWSRFWRDERGSTALTLTWFMLFSLVMAIGVDSFMGVYIARQQGQSAADAAALAVTRAVSFTLPDEVRIEAGRRVAEILSDPILKEHIRSLDSSKMTPEQMRDWLVSEYQAAFGRKHAGGLPRSMAERIIDGTWDAASPEVLRDELIPDDGELACLVMSAAVKHRSEVLDEAEALAQANRAELDRSRTELGLAKGRHRVVVLRTVRPFGAEWILGGVLPKLHIEDFAVLSKVGSRTPAYAEGCGGG